MAVIHKNVRFMQAWHFGIFLSPSFLCVRGTAFMLKSAPASVLLVSAYGSIVLSSQVQGENVTL